MVGSSKRTRVGSTLRVLAAGLVMLVLALAPLHAHAGTPEISGACLLCGVSQRGLEPPVGPAGLAWQPPAAVYRAEDSSPRALLPGDTWRGHSSTPRAPPLHS